MSAISSNATPRSTAIVPVSSSRGGAIATATFARRVYRAANALLAHGIRPQERVAILARNSSEVLEVFGAGEVAGFIIVNINHRLSVPEILAIWGDAQPCALFFEPDFADAAAALRAAFSDIRLFACIGGEAANGKDYEALLSGVPDTSRRRAPSPTTSRI